MTRIKICCISSVEEARMAIAAGASSVGLVSAMPSGPGVVAEERIAEITASLPPYVVACLLTSKTTAPGILEQQARCKPQALQLCDEVAPAEIRALRAALPGIQLIQVIHVTGPGSIQAAQAIAPEVDAILLDSGQPQAAQKTLGGTGNTHDWSLSAEIVRTAGVPVILAGGLRTENVGEAIRRVRPHAVDICSGVRSEDRLDAGKLGTFVEAVGRASRALA